MRDFVYHRATSLDEARQLAAADGAMLLAGGQSLLRDMKLGLQSPASLVDITSVIDKRIELRHGAIWIGAGATHAEAANSPVLRNHMPVLASLVEHIGDPAVRHRGTLGGALAANEPAGDYPAACLALDATIHTTARDVVASDFFIGQRRTALQSGEIVTAATFPVVQQASYIKFLNPAARYAMVGAFAALAGANPRIAITGARADGAFRWRDAETALKAGFVIENLRDIHLSADGLAVDLFADAEYRRHLAEVLTRRAVALASGPAPGVKVISHGSPQTF